jgi:hypothetical protein
MCSRALAFICPLHLHLWDPWLSRRASSRLPQGHSHRETMQSTLRSNTSMLRQGQASHPTYSYCRHYRCLLLLNPYYVPRFLALAIRSRILVRCACNRVADAPLQHLPVRHLLRDLHEPRSRRCSAPIFNMSPDEGTLDQRDNRVPSCGGEKLPCLIVTAY